MRIALFYCTVHFSTQEPETLFESKKLSGLGFFRCFSSFFSDFGLGFFVIVVVFLGFFTPLNLVHKAGLHWISYLPNFCLISKSVQ